MWAIYRHRWRRRRTSWRGSRREGRALSELDYLSFSKDYCFYCFYCFIVLWVVLILFIVNYFCILIGFSFFLLFSFFSDFIYTLYLLIYLIFSRILTLLLYLFLCYVVSGSTLGQIPSHLALQWRRSWRYRNYCYHCCCC